MLIDKLTDFFDTTQSGNRVSTLDESQASFSRHGRSETAEETNYADENTESNAYDTEPSFSETMSAAETGYSEGMN
jgi:hypothetical protein